MLILVLDCLKKKELNYLLMMKKFKIEIFIVYMYILVYNIRNWIKIIEMVYLFICEYLVYVLVFWFLGIGIIFCLS